MTPIHALSVLRPCAAKLPITHIQKVSRFSNEAVLAVLAVCTALLAASSAPTSLAQTVTFAGSGAVNFGAANVCASGKTAPAPCSQSLTLTYKITASGTLGTPKVLTVGAANLDYKLASGSSCTGSVIQGNTCKVNVSFAPLAPGARNGAVEIVDGSGNLLATTYIYGSGVGPRIGFLSPLERDIGASSVYAYGVAADGGGDLFVLQNKPGGAAAIVELLAVDGKVPASPVIQPIQISFEGLSARPSDLTVDGAGNLFVVISTATSYDELFVGYVEELRAADGYSTASVLAGSTDGVGIFEYPAGIAVDGSGNIFVSTQRWGDDSYTPGGNYELPVAGGYTTLKTLAGVNYGYDPTGIAIDASGNLFVASADMANNNVILELPAEDDYATFRTISLGSFGIPTGVAIDPAGDLFVLSYDASSVFEFFAADGVLPATPASLVVEQLTNEAPYGIAIDGFGNLYVPAYNSSEQRDTLQELQLSTPWSLNFATSDVGYASSDSPRSVGIQNQGNADLDVTAVSVSKNWKIDPGGCVSSFSLVASALCNLSISFKPTETGTLTGALDVVDNTLNAPGSTQSSTLSGTGITGPNLLSLSNTYGAPYSVVILNGTAFGSSRGSSTVTFNGIETPHYYWADTKIYVTVPPDATTGNVAVTVDGKASNPIAFTVLPQPRITGISPSSGPPGTLVSISGTNLDDLHYFISITFDGKKIPFPDYAPISSSLIEVSIPTGATTGSFHLVINDTGMNTSTFTVTK
jgi:hypothetical protein